MTWEPTISPIVGRIEGFGWASNPLISAGVPASGWFAVAQELASALSLSAEQAGLVVKATAFALHVSIPEAVAMVRSVAYGTSVDLASATSREIQFSAAPASSSSTAASTAVVKAVASVLSVSKEAAASVLRAVVALANSTSTGPAASRFPTTAAVRTEFTATGAYTYTIPWWSRFIDRITLGAGGGGGGAQSSFTPAQGGDAGVFAWGTLERGVDIPWSLVSITGSVGAPGTAGTGGNSGGNGGATTSTANGNTLTGSGGIGRGGVGTQNGDAVTSGNTNSGKDLTLSGQLYVGGAINSGVPGGGGRGANAFSSGTAGARGQAYYYARQS
ncbi:hypothetical protein BKG86_17245 [Mycobacteroides chelonae]|uniref:glycine-rich domain-containing protein n=1 Tax=Mycobacteroides chelonae TaxID=1774 RepID=UPI0008A8CB96|nr:hypothetical protein [Mycobacteroides chelonae]OHU71398.1 hypothetical protein BKG86_17245 [Mycobacteroides chelonae]